MANTIDFETHLREKKGEKRWYGPRELLALEDEAGIQRAVVIPEAAAKPPNRWVHEQIKNYPRLIGCACINPLLGREAVEELETAVTEWKMACIKLIPSVHGYNIDSPLVHPIMDKAKKLAKPVIIHSGSHGCEPLRIKELAESYSDLPIIMEHMGYPYDVDQALAAARKCDNIYLGTAMVNSEPDIIKRAAEEVGPERIIFGSSAPGFFPVYAVLSLKRVDFSSHEMDLIMGENLARILKINSKERYENATVNPGGGLG